MNEIIKNYIYEQNNSQFKIYVELSSYKILYCLFVNDILMKSKNKYEIINFDPIFYRFNILNNNNNKNFLIEFNQKEIENIFNNNNNKFFIIIGAELLDIKNLNNLLKFLSRKNEINFIFIICSKLNNSNNILLIQNFASILLIEKQNRTNLLKFYSKIEVYNILKLSKDFIIFEYNIDNNNYIKNFNEIKLFSGDVKKLFDEIVKVVEHETTFNVNLTEKERIEKNKVNLPFIKTEKKKKNELIDVDQEDVDDLYEEDPDEDLDI